MWVRRGVNAEDLLTSFAGALEVHFEGGEKENGQANRMFLLAFFVVMPVILNSI
ncbi:hypothetical protein PEB0150_010170 [Bartonella apis]|nr:hypothetical protein PEB0150_010170 [Bartonella apis]